MEENTGDVSVAARLQRLILTSDTLELFLEGFAGQAASIVEGPVGVLCGVTLLRDNQATTVASSSPGARALNEVQYGYGEGPSLHAIRTGATTVVHDSRTDTRWPKYFDAVKTHGYHSLLGVPLIPGNDGGIAVDLYAREPNTFTRRSSSRSKPTPLMYH
ncbi:GAF domain-containing protein [Arthrobacter sp. CAN_A6]|uniref:GAF domain-containing protein n=1 Tax=Arthrobacter sp. CAN_A6 TaxID=2787721 RepID=UPI0018CBD8FF